MFNCEPESDAEEGYDSPAFKCEPQSDTEQGYDSPVLKYECSIHVAGSTLSRQFLFFLCNSLGISWGYSWALVWRLGAVSVEL